MDKSTIVVGGYQRITTDKSNRSRKSKYFSYRVKKSKLINFTSTETIHLLQAKLENLEN